MRRITIPILATTALLALGCKGELIEPKLGGGPGTGGGTAPALAISLGGAGADQILAMVSDPSGNVYVAGSFSGTADFDPGSGVTALTSVGTSDLFLARYSSTGALVWADRIGGTGSETVTALARDAAGNLYLGGGFSGAVDFDPGAGNQSLSSVGPEDGFVAKYSAEGALTWVRRFGGAAADEVRSLAIDPAGNVDAVGVFSGTANTLPAAGPSIVSNGTSTDGFVLSFDPAGTVRWAFAVGGPGDDAAEAARITAGGTLVVTGEYSGTAAFSPGAPSAGHLTSLGGLDVFIAGYSTGGSYLWAGSLGGPADDALPRGALAVDAAGGFAVAGIFSGTIDFDPGPATASRTSVGTADGFIAQYDGATGAFRSVLAFGGSGAGLHIGGLGFDDGGNLLVDGSFSGTVDFDPGATTRLVTSIAPSPGTDIFTARYTPGGGLLWVSRFGDGSTAAGADAATAVAPDGQGGALVAGRFFGSPNFDPGTGSFRLTSLGDADGFVVRLNAAGGLARAP
jgi:hypothetical protein